MRDFRFPAVDPYYNHAGHCFLSHELAAREHKEHKEENLWLCVLVRPYRMVAPARILFSQGNVRQRNEPAFIPLTIIPMPFGFPCGALIRQ